MRVLFSLLDASVGGGQRVAIEVARRLEAEGDNIGLFVPSQGPAAEEFRAVGATVYAADLQTLRRMRGVRPAAAIAANYDVLYSHSSVPGEILGASVARRAKIAHVVHRHTDPHFSPRIWTRAVQRRLYRGYLRTTPFIAVATHVANSLLRLGIERDHIVVIPNGIAVAATRRRRIGAKRKSSLRSIGALGRLDPSRGLDVFAEAARHLSRDGLRLVIGGASGPFHEYETGVRRVAAESGVAIEEPGPRGVEFLETLDIVVIPSIYEGSPLTLFEAMALGKPIVASRIPGIAEVLERSGAGVLVPPGDPEALADAIASLAADAERRDALGRTALEVVRREHDLAHHLDRVVKVLRRAVE